MLYKLLWGPCVFFCPGPIVCLSRPCPRQLLRRLQCKYAFSKLESVLIAYTVFDRFTRKNFSLPNRHTSLIFSVYRTITIVMVYLVMEYTTIYSYGISSKQAYKLSSTLVGKNQTNHLPDQPDSVICTLFTNYSNTPFLVLSIYFQMSTRHDSISI